jgi:hypothetical protein
MSERHKDRTTKYFDRDAGECVCEHCTRLPWHEVETTDAPTPRETGAVYIDGAPAWMCPCGNHHPLNEGCGHCGSRLTRPDAASASVTEAMVARIVAEMLAEVPVKHSGAVAEDFDRARNRTLHEVLRRVRLAAAPRDAGREEMVVRRLLWSNHGHMGMYGDDGEMQCAACAPATDEERATFAGEYVLDWKREPYAKVLAWADQGLRALNMLRAARRGATG